LTIRESDQIYKLMSAVEGLASDARQKAHFYADKHSFAAANLYGLSKKKKGG
jgi:hypothetical protein